MASLAPGMVDPTKAGKYPVILSDELLGKPSNDIYTGVQYNHKPDTNPSFAKLRVAGPSKYDLSYNDNGIYKYQGSRTGDGGQYVLIFDPSREAFVLHKVDSLFTMNLTQTPDNTSAAKLKQQHPHLTKPPKVSSGIKISKPKESAAPKPTTAPKAAKEQKKEPAAASEPTAKAVPKKPTPPSDQEEDSDDDDGGLVMEFPGGEEPSRDFSPAFPPRRFSEFVAQEEDEEDADGEDEEDEMSEEEHFKLPSPMNFHNTGSAPAPAAAPPTQPMQVDDAESEEDGEGGQQDDEELEIDDLEAELVAELEGQAEGGHESESDVSEED